MDEISLTDTIYDEDTDGDDDTPQLTAGNAYEAQNQEAGFKSMAEVRGETISCYPANIAAACHEASVARLQPRAAVVEDSVKLEKRRQCNRLSARRWRMRKRSKFTELQDQIRSLQKEHVQLEFEKSTLQAELKHQLALTKAQSAHLPPLFVNSRLEASQRALRFSQTVQIDQEPGGKMVKDPPNRVQSTRASYPDKLIFKSHTSIKVPASLTMYDSARSARSPAFESGLPGDAPSGNGLSHAQLRAMLQAAAAPCYNLRL